MTVSSYIYQSPYPSSMQMGRPDTSTQSQSDSQSSQNGANEVQSAPKESTVNPTWMGEKVTIDLTALSGSNGAAALNSYQTENAKVQAQSAYQTA